VKTHTKLTVLLITKQSTKITESRPTLIQGFEYAACCQLRFSLSFLSGLSYNVFMNGIISQYAKRYKFLIQRLCHHILA